MKAKRLRLFPLKDKSTWDIVDWGFIKNKLKEMSISDYCFDSLEFWGNFEDTLGSGASFINGTQLGWDSNNLSPVFNLGLTGYSSSHYLSTSLNLVSFSLVLWVYLRGVNQRNSLIESSDFEVAKESSFGSPFVMAFN